MTLRRALPWACVLLLAAAAPVVAQLAPQEPPCMKDFAVLRDDTARKADAIRAASARKASAPEACQLFKALVLAEGKMVKFVQENAVWCGVPPDVPRQMKANHDRTLAIRTRVCSAAAAPAAASPSLSDALGAPRTPDAGSIKPGRGTFDTLTGTPLGSK